MLAQVDLVALQMLPAFFVLLPGLIVLFVHVSFASGVYVHAGRRQREQLPLHFVGQFTWSMAVLVFGVIGLGVYWLLHGSAIRDDAPFTPRGPHPQDAPEEF